MREPLNVSTEKGISRRSFLERMFTATVVGITAPSILSATIIPKIALRENSLSGLYTIDLNAVVALQNVLGSVRLSIREIDSRFRIVVTRVSEDQFEAVYGRCPHQDFLIRPRESTNDYLICSGHDSRFQFNGTLIPGFGPAEASLKRYTTSYDGDATVTVEIDELASVSTSESSSSYITLHSTGPLDNQVVFKFGISRPEHLVLSLLSLDGKEVLRPLDGLLEAGSHHLPCDLSSLESGLYLYRLTSSTAIIGTGKVVVTK
ncbi:MAG: Rieske 2Fe-2S domain-containing protein [Ignavibacteriae bacterium]|nr:Rieske 2Fe-2S domain-containing protein [Ignavibacteriota bacterium]MCB9214891.1 Rieske 2Fe-2S domain-containing protein [Ignavibacteria bacterium]